MSKNYDAPVHKKDRGRMTNYEQITMPKITNKKTKGSHGLHHGTFKLQTMTALIKSFCGGVQMLHGGSFFKKRPPWPPEAKKEKIHDRYFKFKKIHF
jgi:hypothetical protein